MPDDVDRCGGRIEDRGVDAGCGRRPFALEQVLVRQPEHRGAFSLADLQHLGGGALRVGVGDPNLITTAEGGDGQVDRDGRLSGAALAGDDCDVAHPQRPSSGSLV